MAGSVKRVINVSSYLPNKPIINSQISKPEQSTIDRLAKTLQEQDFKN